jgi:hypothetical protein
MQTPAAMNKPGTMAMPIPACRQPSSTVPDRARCEWEAGAWNLAKNFHLECDIRGRQRTVGLKMIGP